MTTHFFSLLETTTMTNLFSNALEILIFKTNLRFKKDVRKAAAFLNAEPRILDWNVDLEDRDLVLRVEGVAIETDEVVNIFKNAGYYCEELPD